MLNLEKAVESTTLAYCTDLPRISDFSRLNSLTHRGFTLIELLLSVSLLATLFWFAMPFLSALYQKNQVQVIEHDIKRAIHYAKTQALMRGKALLLSTLPGTNDWSTGIVLYTSDSKETIHEWHWSFSNIHVAWHGFQSNHYLLFSADPGQNNVNGSFLITSRSRYASRLVINKLGRTKSLLVL